MDKLLINVEKVGTEKILISGRKGKLSQIIICQCGSFNQKTIHLFSEKRLYNHF